MHHTAVPKHRENKRPRNPANRLLHTDWWGKFSTPGLNGETFIQVFIDDESGYVWAFPSRRKDCGGSNLQRVEAELRELLGGRQDCQVSAIQSDSDVVYTAGAFAEWCDTNGVIQRFSAPYTPQHNGRAERFWRTLETGVASIFCYSNVALHFWPRAVAAHTHAFNLTVPHGGTLTPYEILTTR
jgi:transposase InsO family protein